MAAKQRDEAERLRQQGSTARRLASQLSETTDRKELLRYAGVLEERASRLECRPPDED
ncbi:MAG: hypothetical protein K2X72_34895 [Reyranella sp.]|nr:hypothetical protein [Reyranella sp.]